MKKLTLSLILALSSGSALHAEEITPAGKTYEKTPEALKKLTPLQYKVTQEGMTEKPYDNEYWNNFKDGIYVDVVTGQPLFSSLDKYDAKNGWPAFHKPINEDFIAEKQDNSYGMSRTEVETKNGSSHLGHVFDEGSNERHYCINSSSLRFIPKEKLIDEGYAEYVTLFIK